MRPYLALGAIFLALACSPPGPPAPPTPEPADSVETITWAYAPGAIQIGLLADQGLNGARDGPTGLAWCLYQLADPSRLLTLAQTQAGLLSLLNCSPDLPGTVSATRYYAQPGQRQDLWLDRLEKTRYVAVVAGYQSLRPAQSVGLLPIPIEESRRYFFFKAYQPLTLAAWLILKPQTAQFLPKSERDQGRLARDLGTWPQTGSETLASKTPPSETPVSAGPGASDATTLTTGPGQPLTPGQRAAPPAEGAGPTYRRAQAKPGFLE
jgi:predicted component of type VI protein secretion system